MKYDTSNPEWFKAKRAEDIIAKPPASILGKLLLDKVNETHLTQGPLAGDLFGDQILPWQARIVKWLPFVDEIAIKCGKGSGKSFFVGALALGMAKTWIAEKSHRRGLIAILSANVESARIVFQHINEAILYDRSIREFWKPNASTRSIVHIESGIIIQILPPKMNRAIGLRPVLLIIDELHEAASVSGFDDVLRQLVHGGRNWEDFKTIVITTAPPREASPAYTDWLVKARAVRDGKVKNLKLLPCLFEFPVLQRPDLDYEKMRSWYFGMPSLIRRKGGKGTMLAKTMREELKAAELDIEISGIDDYQSLLSQRLGIEAEERQGGGLTLLADLWPGAKINGEHKAILPDNPERIFIAMDPSEGLNDPFAVVHLMVYGDLWIVESKQWITEKGTENISNKLKAVYNKAVELGELSICKTDRDIEAEVIEYCRQFKGDIHFGGDAAGLVGFNHRFAAIHGQYEPVPQGWQLIAAFRAAQGATHAGRLKHYGNTLLQYNVKNLRIHNGRFAKSDIQVGNADAFNKIDGAMAMMSAVFMLESTPVIDIGSLIG